MPAAAEPTTAPAAPESTAPPAPTNPESKQTIHVVPPPVEAGPPPKPGSARDRMRQALRQKAGIEEEEPTPAPVTAPSKPDKSPADKASPTKPAGSPEPDAKPTPSGSPPASKEGDKGKVNPWKVVDQYKAKTAELEQKLAESSALPEKEKKEFLTRIEKAEARNKELEDAIRFVNYRKSAEFQKTYQEPYEKAWNLAMSDLKEIPVNLGDGQTRPATTDDMVSLVMKPLADARAEAEAMFGPFANDVMAHRKAIKQLWDAQAQALADAEKNGAQREKEHNELTQKRIKDIEETISQTWASANEAATKDERHGKYFVPIEGDEEGNQKLAKGFELVDRAFRENPKDPSLSPEQRASIIKRHAAVRNRAAAYGRLVYLKEQADSRIAELEKELAEIKSTQPPTGGDKPAGSVAVSGSARDRMHEELRKRAQ